MLLNYFKPQPANALQALKSMEYSIKHIRLGYSPRAYAQEVFRHAKAAQVTSVFNQLTLAWSQLDIWLCCDIPEPAPEDNYAGLPQSAGRKSQYLGGHGKFSLRKQAAEHPALP